MYPTTTVISSPSNSSGNRLSIGALLYRSVDDHLALQDGLLERTYSKRVERALGVSLFDRREGLSQYHCSQSHHALSIVLSMYLVTLQQL